MTRTGVVPSGDTSRQAISAERAMKLAWRAWFGLLVVPFALFFLTLLYMADSDPVPPADSRAATLWFILTLSYIGLSVPVAFFWRSHLFKRYWVGDRVPPREYLIGMVSVWVALMIGGVASVAGCIFTRSMVPNLLPAALAFVFYAALWPNGHSMSRPLRSETDPMDYEDPR